MNRFAAVLLSLAVLPLAAWADPPGRVARLALVEGQASVFTDPEQGWEDARINTHLTSENSLWTEPGARAEVRFGSTAIRLGEVTQLDILQLDDSSFHGHVARGTLTVRIRDFDRAESYAVTTPDARFQLRSNGRYRIDADLERGESRLTVFSGTARLDTVGGSISIDTSRSVRVTGGERPRYEFEAAYATAIDEWALARDQRFDERETSRYVPPQMTGWEDLDDYGVWRNEPEYGPVWFPTRVEAGWAPYRYGRWTWVRPWGWAWVDDAPWGYAPFHYGRWAFIGSRWGWYPGHYTTRPVWAPALVGWVGRPGWNISISTGLTDVVGWYPLSPYDRFQPWYATNVTYVTNVNRIVIPPRWNRDRRDDRRPDRRDDRGDNRHDNRDRGATVVPRNQFGSHRPVQNVLAPVSRDVVAAQPVVSGSSVLPSRNEWRSRPKPVQSSPAPRAAASGEPVGSPRMSSPLAPAPGAPAARPRATTPAAPAYAAPQAAPQVAPRVAPRVAPQAAPQAAPQVAPRVAPQAAPQAAPQSAPTSRFARPAPAEPALRAKPAPVEPATQAKPPEPRAIELRVPRAIERAAPVQVQPHVQPEAQPRMQPQAQPQAQPQLQSSPLQQRVQPQAQPQPAAVPVAPAANPAPVQERPARGGERPSPRPVEKPARPADTGQGG
ncbi:MAG TPA: DUF6600 domain-containing protein [Usitatibacteraceae bacterium]|nr:DUF6600 domain-containing protein [Usitatibacteraceae bacterium]